ncbi:MAG: hypothetical protein Q7S93_01265 [Phenylobacterium sp.]|uniref:hypothetical protein n=1 Tax=Phenylobacterium sp. TaxID=1871053 RepID=UPI002716EB09|nr:hypothetical protein [Phenylobacterium sp.]MDO8408683.1 hypothetical protein [Phenylobacterium sp.]
MLSALAFGLLLLGQESQATLQSCVLEAEGWVCRYRVPDTIYRPMTDQDAAAASPPQSAPLLPPADPANIAATGPVGEPSGAEAIRQARLIRRCAEASWMSLCTPGDRREARALQDAADARAALRLEVTTLAAQDQCDAAVRTALEGGDLPLAREIRAFCATEK